MPCFFDFPCLRNDVGLKDAWFVAYVTEWGFFAWNVVCMVNKGNRLVNMKVQEGEKKWECKHITDLKGWMVYEVEALPPCSVVTKGADGKTLGVVIKVSGQPVPILQSSSDNAYKGMTTTYMTKLLKFLEVDVDPIPTLEAEIVKTLLKYCLPGISEDDLIAKMQKRHLVKAKFSTILTPEMVTQAGGLLGDSTCKEMTEELISYCKKVEAEKNLLPKPKAESKKKPRQKVLAAKDHESWAAAQKYKPAIEDCTLSMETEWHCRWKITYPRDLPPYSNSAPYDDKDPASCRQALYAVLRWAWQNRTEKTKEPCPWNFEG